MRGITENIRQLLKEAGPRGIPLAEIQDRLDAPRSHTTRSFRRLVRRGEIQEMPGGRFRLASPGDSGRPSGRRTPGARGPGPDADRAEGTIQVHRDGYGFVTVDDPEIDKDVWIPREATQGAMDGDRVEIVFARRGDRDQRLKGEVSKIVERARKTLCGYLEQATRERYLLVPTNPDRSETMELRRQDLGGAEAGQVVVARITRYGDGSRPLAGEVLSVLGEKDDPAIDSEMIIAEHDLRTEWPRAVLEAAEKVPTKVPARQRERRLDLRDQPCFTIDGKDARDLDDAVYLEPLPGSRGGSRLWVHIADVSHYVRPGDPIDQEATLRGTSTYLPDRVIPMLPVALSNGICSLNPDVDRLALSCRIDFDRAGHPTGSKVLSTVIRSHARLTYQDVHDACVDKDRSTRRRLGDHTEVLDRMFTLAAKLRKHRRKAGAIDFDLPSVKVVVDDRGRPVDIVHTTLDEAYGLIEQFMVAANEAVSRWMVEGERDFVFRIHETPDPTRLQALAELAGELGLSPKGLDRGDPRPALASLLEQAEGRPEENLIRTTVLRCMKLARYSPDNLGHFGLGSEAYTHFTSPIRRYPDLLVHRLLKDRTGALRLTKKARAELLENLGEILVEMSRLERKAEAAERDALHLKKIHYLRDAAGKTFRGLVSGVKDFGAFVELTEILADGMIHISELGSDFWQYDEAGRRLVGTRSEASLRLGDQLDVVVISADPTTRKLALRPARDLATGEETVAPSGREKAADSAQAKPSTGPSGKNRETTRSTRGRKDGSGRSGRDGKPASRSPGDGGKTSKSSRGRSRRGRGRKRKS